MDETLYYSFKETRQKRERVVGIICVLLALGFPGLQAHAVKCFFRKAQDPKRNKRAALDIRMIPQFLVV